MRFSPLKMAIAAAILMVGFAAYRSIGNQSHFQEMPKTISNFAAIATTGDTTDYQSERGKATLIVLSAAWCPACLAEIPTLKKLHQEYLSEGFKVLMVSEDDNLKQAAKFKKKHEFPWTVVHWNYNLMNKLGNPRVIPVSYLVDGEGNIREIEAGILDEQKMRSAIERILK